MVYGAIVSNFCSRSHGQPLPGLRSAAISSMSRAMSREGFMPASRVGAGVPALGLSSPLGSGNDSHKKYYGTSGYSRAFAAVSAWIRPVRRSPQGFRGQADLHAVISRLDVLRELAAQGLVVEIGMQIDQHGALRPDALDPRQRILDGEMTRMRRIAQRVENPDFEISQYRYAVRRDTVEIARIREIAEPEAERMHVAVGLEERGDHDGAAGALDRQRPICLEPMLGQDRWILAAG